MDQIEPPAARLPGRPLLAGSHPTWARGAAAAGAVLLSAHALVHLMGTALLWRLGQPGQLRYAGAVPTPGSPAGHLAGTVWLAAAVLFGAAAILLARCRPAWRITALAGVATSVPVLSLTAGRTATGLVLDGLVFATAVAGLIHDRMTRGGRPLRPG